MKSFEHIPNAIRGIGPGDKPMVDFSAYPPGLATLGLGPVPVATLAEGKLKLGNFFGLDFTEEGPPPADGFYSRGVLTGINNGGEDLPEGTVPAQYTPESFGVEFAGFHPMCKWNISMARRPPVVSSACQYGCHAQYGQIAQ